MAYTENHIRALRSFAERRMDVSADYRGRWTYRDLDTKENLNRYVTKLREDKLVELTFLSGGRAAYSLSGKGEEILAKHSKG